MADLRKYSYKGRAQKGSSTRNAAESEERPSSPGEEPVMDTAALKADILSELRADISSILKSELKLIFTEEFKAFKAEIQNEIQLVKNNTASIHSEIDSVKTAVQEVEDGLSTWTDIVVPMEATVAKLQTELEDLKEKCNDLESRMRRSNIRVTGLGEREGSSSPTAISKLLKELINDQKEFLIDRSHRGLAPGRDGKPRVVVAKLHYDQDCAEVLRHARQHGPYQYEGQTIHIFPDRTSRDAKTFASFNDVRLRLKNRDNARYGFLHPNRLRITIDGTTREFKDPAKAMEFVNHKLPTSESTDAADPPPDPSK